MRQTGIEASFCTVVSAATVLMSMWALTNRQLVGNSPLIMSITAMSVVDWKSEMPVLPPLTPPPLNSVNGLVTEVETCCERRRLLGSVGFAALGSISRGLPLVALSRNSLDVPTFEHVASVLDSYCLLPQAAVCGVPLESVTETCGTKLEKNVTPTNEEASVIAFSLAPSGMNQPRRPIDRKSVV